MAAKKSNITKRVTGGMGIVGVLVFIGYLANIDGTINFTQRIQRLLSNSSVSENKPVQTIELTKKDNTAIQQTDNLSDSSKIIIGDDAQNQMIIQGSSNVFINQTSKPTETPMATPTSLPPTDAIIIPTNKEPSLFVSVDFQSKLPGYAITKKLDRESLHQIVDLNQDILNEKESKKFVILMNQIFLPSWSVNVAGKVDNEDVLLYGQSIPIQIVSYRPITEELDLILVGYGGGVDLFTYLTDISEHALSLPDRIVEAFPDPCTDKSYGNEECIKGKISPPKFISLKHNERVAFDVRTPFKYHGIYQVRLGVRYTYQGYEHIAWADPPIEIIVPQSYYSWTPSDTSANPNDYMIRGKCIWAENGEYDCNSNDPSVPKDPSNMGQPIVDDFRACLQPCNETTAIKTFPEKTVKIYAQWSFTNIPNGADYVRIWNMNGQEWARYTCKWDGSVSGIQKVELTEPMGLHSGIWEMRIIINNQVLLQEQIEVTGNWNYWLPAGTFARCNS